MNLLFDQNISFRILKKLDKIFENSKHISELGLHNAPDIEIWNFARKNDYTIVTFDSDFIDISNLQGHPPKIIWLNLGNTSTHYIADRLVEEKEIIISFIMSEDSAFLEIP